MDTRENLEQNTQVLEVTENAKKYLKSTASWSLFFAVLGFIGIVFMVGYGIVILANGIYNPSIDTIFLGNAMSSIAKGFGVFYLVLGIVLIFPSLYLLRFWQKAKKALASQDTVVLEEAFKNMKSYWKFNGIMTIVMIVIMVLYFVLLAAFIMR